MAGCFWCPQRDNNYSYLNERIDVLVFGITKSIQPNIVVMLCWLYRATDTIYWYFIAIFIHEYFLYHSNKNIFWCETDSGGFPKSQRWLWFTHETMAEQGCVCDRRKSVSQSLSHRMSDVNVTSAICPNVMFVFARPNACGSSVTVSVSVGLRAAL